MSQPTDKDDGVVTFVSLGLKVFVEVFLNSFVTKSFAKPTSYKNKHNIVCLNKIAITEGQYFIQGNQRRESYGFCSSLESAKSLLAFWMYDVSPAGYLELSRQTCTIEVPSILPAFRDDETHG